MIEKITKEEKIRATYPVMSQLRCHLTEQQYVEAVLRQQQNSPYQLAVLSEDGRVCCLAGYRISECLAWGKFLYVDDLVSDGNLRSKNHGKQMMQWLVEEAIKNGCKQLHLDSGVQRHGAHRFYLRERMDITCYHFALPVQ
jgi:GNAT superfamily N-acetyltransferase